MQWFGESWGAPVCDPKTHIPTPVGSSCAACSAPIAAADCGVHLPFVGDPSGKGYLDYHHLCFLRSILPERLIHKGQA